MHRILSAPIVVFCLLPFSSAQDQPSPDAQCKQRLYAPELLRGTCQDINGPVPTLLFGLGQNSDPSCVAGQDPGAPLVMSSSGILANLAFTTSLQAVGGTVSVVVLVNGHQTSLACFIDAATHTECFDTRREHEIDVKKGDTVAIEFVGKGTGGFNAQGSIEKLTPLTIRP